MQALPLKDTLSREHQQACSACMDACQAIIVACEKLKDLCLSDKDNFSQAYRDCLEQATSCIKNCEKMIAESKAHLTMCKEDYCKQMTNKCIEQCDLCIKGCGYLRECDKGRT